MMVQKAYALVSEIVVLSMNFLALFTSRLSASGDLHLYQSGILAIRPS